MTTKKCGICGLDKPYSDYGRDGGARYLRYECRSCARAQSRLLRTLRSENPRPGPDYRCPICDRNWQEMQGNSIRTKQWACDHDHITNKFRGWLCAKCNLALGNLGDSVQRLRNAVAYLESREKGPSG